eukprot:scaffold3350_cov268-Pinguiococcus_pyrenoidosus.AAC.26
MPPRARWEWPRPPRGTRRPAQSRGCTPRSRVHLRTRRARGPGCCTSRPGPSAPSKDTPGSRSTPPVAHAKSRTDLQKTVGGALALHLPSPDMHKRHERVAFLPVRHGAGGEHHQCRSPCQPQETSSHRIRSVPPEEALRSASGGSSFHHQSSARLCSSQVSPSSDARYAAERRSCCCSQKGKRERHFARASCDWLTWQR